MRLSCSQRASASRCSRRILTAWLQKGGQVFPAGHSRPSIHLDCVVALEVCLKGRS